MRNSFAPVRARGLRHIVILIDVSGSIDRTALEQAFKAVDELVSQLNRGDKIAIIPILGDALADTSGQIIRFEVPTQRQPYDSDLHRFRIRLKSGLEKMKSAAIAHPGARTDVLGSIVLASQEFTSDAKDSKHVLVMLSDFIHESTSIDFRTDRRLASIATAKKFAMAIATEISVSLKTGMIVYLGLMRSNEYKAMNPTRRAALQDFWIEYFKHLGTRPKFVIDGPAMLNGNI